MGNTDQKLEPTQDSFSSLIAEVDKRLSILQLEIARASWSKDSGTDVLTFFVRCRRCRETGIVDMPMMIAENAKVFPDLLPMAGGLRDLVMRWYVDRHHLTLDAQLLLLRQAKLIQEKSPAK